MTRRVAVTGVGVIAAPGCGREAFWEALSRGEGAIRPMELIAPGTLRFLNGAEVRGYRTEDYFDERQADVLDRSAQFAVIAAREAVRDAGLTFGSEPDEGTAIITGCSAGGQTVFDEGYRRIYAEDHTHIHPFQLFRGR